MSSLPKRPFADVDVSESDDPSTSTAPPPKKHYEKSRHNKRPKPGALRSLASIPTAKLLYPRISEPQITNVPFQQPLPPPHILVHTGPSPPLRQLSTPVSRPTASGSGFTLWVKDVGEEAGWEGQDRCVVEGLDEG